MAGRESKWTVAKQRTATHLLAARSVKALAPTKVADVSVALENDEDALRRSPARKNLVIGILAVVNTADILGEVLTMPIMPYLFQQIPGASQRQINGGLGRFASDAERMGVGLTMNVGPSVYVLGAFVASLMSPYYHKVFGKRVTFMIWTLGGAVGFFLAGLAGDRDWGIAAFWFFRFLTGLFAGAEPTLSGYIADLCEDPAERSTTLAIAQGVSFPFALLIGPLAGKFLADLNGQHTTMFVPFFGGALLELVAFAFVVMYVPNISAKKAEDGKKSDDPLKGDNAAGQKVADPSWKRYIYFTWFAGFFAEIGEGALNHVQSRGFLMYEWIADNFTWVFMMFSLVVFFAMPLGLTMMQRSPAYASSIFRAVSAVLLGLVPLTTNLGSYLFLVDFHYVFKIAAQMSADNMVVDLSPVELRDNFIAYDKAFQQLMNGISPFLFVPLFLDNERWGPYPKGCNPNDQTKPCFVSTCGSIYPDSLCNKFPEHTFLIATAVATAVAAFCYIPLFKRFPWKPADADLKYVPNDEETEALKEFEEGNGIEGGMNPEWLGMKDMIELNMARAQKELPPFTINFGTFQDDKASGNLGRIARYAKRDYEYMMRMNSAWTFTLKHGTPEEKAEITAFLDSVAAADPPSEQDKKEFMEWMWDWMQYAGYGNPAQSPRVWKAVFMTTFPFLLENGEKNPHFKERAVEFMERGEHVLRNLLKLEKSNDKLLHTAGRLNFRALGFTGL